MRVDKENRKAQPKKFAKPVSAKPTLDTFDTFFLKVTICIKLCNTKKIFQTKTLRIIINILINIKKQIYPFLKRIFYCHVKIENNNNNNIRLEL